MKLPALLLAASFAAGIVLADWQDAPPRMWALLAAVMLAGAVGFVVRRALTVAVILAAVGWMFLGALGAQLHQVAVPANHVARLVDSGALDTTEPLRWRGTLRSDPVRLPWGLRFEIDLNEVEVAGRPAPVTGGLRASLFRIGRQVGRQQDALPQVRAGDRVEALVRARPPRNFLNPGAFDARTHMARQGVHLTGSLRSGELLQRIDGPPPGIAHRLARVRGDLLARIDTMFAHAPEQAAILRAMLLGDRSFVDYEVTTAFQETAAYHVLVISGLHVAAMAAFVYFFARLLRLPLGFTVLVTLATLGAFVAVVEDRPPIERAALMAVIVLLAKLLYRRVDLLNTVAVAALLLLIARPSALADPSFQFSFLAAGMIGALALPWVDRSSAPYRRALEHLTDATRDAAHAPRAAQWRLDVRDAAAWLAARLPARAQPRAASLVTRPLRFAFRLWEVLLVSSTIQLGMLPLMAWYFHRVTPGGPLTNIPTPILAGLIVPFGFLSLMAASISEWLGSVTAIIAGMLTEGLLANVRWFAGFQWMSYRVPGPPAWVVAVFFAALVAVAAASRTKRAGRWHWALALPLVIITAVIATHPFAPLLEAGRTEVTVLDVGQGDAVFVAFPGGRTLLVDGGGMFGASRVGGARTGLDIGEQVVSPYLWRRGIKRLDVVALTHAHSDHMDGLFAILDNFEVGELWVGRNVATPAFRALVERAEARGVRVVHRRRGEWFDFDGVTGIVLWPEESSVAASASNNDSLVLRLEHGGLRFLLAGDIERDVERVMVERGDPLDAHFLKVPHHGSRTSATAVFANAVKAREGAISLGANNPFRHPHREVVDRLNKAGTRLLRTDRDGAVTASSDGTTLRVTSFVQTRDTPR